MSSFRIPLVWQMYGHVDVEADTLDDAIEYALGPDCPLPEGEYVDDSIQVDDLVLNQEATYLGHLPGSVPVKRDPFGCAHR